MSALPPNESESPTNNWNSLSSDLTEHILSLLPILSIVVASAVCKRWRELVTNPSFSARANKPWLFLYGRTNIYPEYNKAFAFDPESHAWICLPPAAAFFRSQPRGGDSIIGAGGFFFTASSKITYAPLLSSSAPRETPPLRFARFTPLVGVFFGAKFIVVGGFPIARGFVGILDPLPTEIYYPERRAWELCPPLPADIIHSGNTPQRLSSAIFNGSFFVMGIYSSFVASFELTRREWSEVRTLRPPGVVFSFLVACRSQLVLAAVCNGGASASLDLWSVEERTMEVRKVSTMPRELLWELFDSDEAEKLKSLKCVGVCDLIYVFNKESRKRCLACACEMEMDSQGSISRCSWRKLPSLPGPVNGFHRLIGVCSPVSIGSLWDAGESSW